MDLILIEGPRRMLRIRVGDCRLSTDFPADFILWKSIRVRQRSGKTSIETKK